MKNILLIFIFLVSFLKLFSQINSNFVTSDIDNFWTAYDKIISTKDSVQQYNYINQLYIYKGSNGLKAIMLARRYTDKSYIDAINNYPLFWKSIRANTFKSKQIAKDIESDVSKLKKLYPALRPSKIYFTIGAFRTPGTTMDSMILIGSEIAMADKNVITKEFPKTLSNLPPYFATNPIDNMGFSNVHEYVHTQQKTTIGDNLLAQCVLEGVAEFIAVKATGKKSTAPALTFGYEKGNFEKIRTRFETQMFNASNGFWLYENADNEFKVRDLGYYVGYVICEKYYNKASNKMQAVKEMIELNYNNEMELKKFIQKSGYFTKTFDNLKMQYDKSRPIVTGIKQFQNESQNVEPGLKQITLTFSTAMNKNERGFDFGPLGENNVLRVKKVIGFSDDGKSFTFEVELDPKKRYQSIVSNRFETIDGVNLKPFLIDFVTADK